MVPQLPESLKPAVDMVIAVHSASRPIDRAVSSIARAGLPLNGRDGVRVNVVCHNIGEAIIRERIQEPLRGQVRYLTCNDGISSPAGPFNVGLTGATAPYVSIMGSDDTLEPGALAQWLAVAQRHDSAAVLAPERHANGGKVRTPPVRVGRSRRLDPIRDRLSYRTAPLGLVRTAEIQRLGLHFTEGYKSGEDQDFSARLYFGGGRIDYARGAGHYLVGADATDRVTSDVRPIREDFAFATDLVTSSWFAALPESARSAIVTKLIRVHIFGVASSRDEVSWPPGERRALAETARELIDAAPRATSPLSIADVRLLTAIMDPAATNAQLLRLAVLRKKFGAPSTLVASNLWSQFSAEAPLRFMAASALL